MNLARSMPLARYTISCATLRTPTVGNIVSLPLVTSKMAHTICLQQGISIVSTTWFTDLLPIGFYPAINSTGSIKGYPAQIIMKHPRSRSTPPRLLAIAFHHQIPVYKGLYAPPKGIYQHHPQLGPPCTHLKAAISLVRNVSTAPAQATVAQRLFKQGNAYDIKSTNADRNEASTSRFHTRDSVASTDKITCLQSIHWQITHNLLQA